MGTPAPPPPPGQPPPIQPPAWLSDDGRGYWVDLLRHLAPGTIGPTDVHAFAMLCNALDLYAKCDADVQGEGLTRTGEMGGVYVHPLVKVRAAAGAEVAKWCEYLRITPDDRVARTTRGRIRHRHEQRTGGLT